MPTREHTPEAGPVAGVVSTDSPDYEYPPVSLPSDKYIRILDILPGRFEDNLHLNLRNCEISTVSNYEALSYTWGARTEGHSVVVNGVHRFPVTDNLFRALRRLRRWFRKRTIWIDAICINQSDLKERANQVGVMGDIYRCASCVIIWIGEPSDQRTLRGRFSDGLSALSALASQEYFHLSVEALAVILHLFRGVIRDLEGATESTVPRWHERAWVIQEFLLARRVQILFGSRRWGLKHVKRAPLPLLPASVARLHRVLSSYSLYSSVYCDEENAKRVLPWTVPDLYQMTELLGNAETTDPRDMIYSVLGLIDDREASLVGIDYTLPFAEVCAKATYASIRFRNDFALLCGVGSFDHPARRTFASWAIDFRLRLVSERAYMSYYMTSELRCKEDAMAYIPELNHALDTLTLSGIKCGRVEKCMRMTGRPRIERAHDLLRDTIEECFADSASPELQPMLRRMLQVPWQTQPPDRGSFYNMDGVLQSICWQSGGIFDIEEGLRCVVFCWEALVQALWNQQSFETDEIKKRFEETRSVRSYEDYESTTMCSLFVLDNGVVGLAYEGMGLDDMVVACHGSCDNFAPRQALLSRSSAQKPTASPFLILRPFGDTYKFRGLAWVHGCMHREFWEGWDAVEEHRQTFNIK